MNPNPVRWHAWLGAIAIFFLGLTFGIVGTVFVGARVIRRALRTPPAVTLADRATARMGRDLARELQLTPEEEARVNADLAQVAADLRATRQRTMQEMRQEVRAAMVRIGRDLPPEKRPLYREYLRRRLHRAGMEDFAPPPGD